MDYFWLCQDRRLSGAIDFPNSYDTIHPQKALAVNYDGLKPLTTVRIKPKPDNFYPDVLDRPLYLVSKKMKDLFALFLTEIPYKIFCTIDNQNKVYHYYYAYALPPVHCLSTQSVFNKDRTKAEKIVLRPNRGKSVDILRVAGVNCHMFLVSLPIAEYILNHDFSGIRLIKTTFEQEDNQ